MICLLLYNETPNTSPPASTLKQESLKLLKDLGLAPLQYVKSFGHLTSVRLQFVLHSLRQNQHFTQACYCQLRDVYIFHYKQIMFNVTERNARRPTTRTTALTWGPTSYSWDKGIKTHIKYP